MRRQFLILWILFLAPIAAEALAIYCESKAYIVLQSSARAEPRESIPSNTVVSCQRVENGENQACGVNLYETFDVRESLSGLAYFPRYAFARLSFHALATYLHMLHIIGLAILTIASQVFLISKLKAGLVPRNAPCSPVLGLRMHPIGRSGGD